MTNTRTGGSTRLPEHRALLAGTTKKSILSLNCLLSLVYFGFMAFAFHAGNHLLFGLLLGGELFHIAQTFGYFHTIWDRKPVAQPNPRFMPPVDVYITVCGEPVDLVRKTAKAAMRMRYPRFRVYLLNDGFVARRSNWKDIRKLAAELGISCITRRKPGGAKAGNINNALTITKNKYVVVFDADHVPHPDFLVKTIGYFYNRNVGFVQTPQYYKNWRTNDITATAWQQQSLFFGPIMMGKNRLNSVFMCGTNMVFNRVAVEEAGGMCESNIAEDFLTSLFVHQHGWESVYVPEVLAEGLAPEDFLSYYKQQFRWTRGSLEVIFKYNPLFLSGLSFQQRLQYLISASYYFSGVVVLIDAILPILFLFTGIVAMQTSTMVVAMIFLPYVSLNLYTLQQSDSFTYTFKAIAFSLGCFYLQIRAIWAIATREETKFAVTSKRQIRGNFLYLVIPHIIYVGLFATGLAVGLLRDGPNAALIANASWALIYCVVFTVFIYAAAPRRQPAPQPAPRLEPKVAFADADMTLVRPLTAPLLEAD